MLSETDDGKVHGTVQGSYYTGESLGSEEYISSPELFNTSLTWQYFTGDQQKNLLYYTEIHVTLICD